MSDNENHSPLDSKFKVKDLTKQRFIKFGVIAATCVILLWFIRTTGTHKLAEPAPEQIQLGIDDNLLSDDVFQGFTVGLQRQDELINDMSQRQAETEQKFEDMAMQIQNMSDLFKAQLEQGSYLTDDGSPDPSLSPIPIESNGASFPQPPEPLRNSQITINTNDLSVNAVKKEWIGGLTVHKGAAISQKKTQGKVQQFYMPPSFMTAKTLSGIDAMTNKESLTMPETIMLMIDAPAVLPNHIKKDLKGCYVVANANGNLAKERVQLQVVRLSCMSADGAYFIDEEVLGFASDNDGKRDLSGNVVSRAGTNTALLFVASAVGAIGNQAALSTVTQTTNLSTGTETQTFEASKALQAGLGMGVKDATNEYKKILVDYIRQASPVVEIGALKDATVYIQKGTWLKIQSSRDSKEANKDA